MISSGGTTPVSVAVRGDLIYVLNAGGTGSIQGFYAHSLAPIPGSNRSLGLTPGLTPAFLNTPGQIGFTPDGRHLVVTTKANGSAIDVFDVTPTGSVTGPPVVNPFGHPRAVRVHLRPGRPPGGDRGGHQRTHHLRHRSRRDVDRARDRPPTAWPRCAG